MVDKHNNTTNLNNKGNTISGDSVVFIVALNPLNPTIKIVAPIYFLQKKRGEVDKISSNFILCDHVRNSHDHSILQSIDITRRNLMLITPRA